MRVALYGGTFNPPHNGHLTAAQEAHRLLSLDVVVFIPSYLPPHKSHDNIISVVHRMAMVESMIMPYSYMQVSDIELLQEKVCYTIDTVRVLKEQHPDWDTLYFLVGTDFVSDFRTWKNYESLFQEVQIVVAARFAGMAEERDDRFIYLDNCVCEVSATRIRDMIRTGASYERYVPSTVRAYIQKHSLYGPHKM